MMEEMRKSCLIVIATRTINLFDKNKLGLTENFKNSSFQ